MGISETSNAVKGTKAKVFEVIKRRIKPEGPNKVVIASHKGKAAIKLAELLGKQAQVISVTEFSYDDDAKKDMKKLNVIPVEKASLPIQDNREMRETLLMFGSGIKAALEVAIIAKNMNLVKGEFLAVAGGDESFDTLLLCDTEFPEKEMVSDPVKHLKVKEFLV